MATLEGKIVELSLVTGDDALAAAFAADLEAHVTWNPVHRYARHEDCLEYIGDAQGARSAQIVILDMRNDPPAAMRFLNELHNRFPFAEPVTFLIGAGDHEKEILAAHERFIAGQLPDVAAGKAFVEWAVSMLADNWTFEPAENRR